MQFRNNNLKLKNMVYSITTVPSGKVHEALGISTERADHFIDAITTKLDELSEKN